MAKQDATPQLEVNHAKFHNLEVMLKNINSVAIDWFLPS
jgi:hypothetical protein